MNRKRPIVDKIKKSFLFRTISIVLILTFVSLDISYAYPPEHNASNSTLAIPSALQQQPINEQAVRFQHRNALITLIHDVDEYSFGNKEKGIGPLPSKSISYVMSADLEKYLKDTGIDILNIVPVEYIKETASDKLKSALDEISFKGTFPDKGVVFVLCKRHDKKFLLLIANKGEVSPENIPGRELEISDKLLVKYMFKDHVPAVEKLDTSSTLSEDAIVNQQSQAVPAIETREERGGMSKTLGLLAGLAIFISGCSASDSSISTGNIVLAVLSVAGALVLFRISTFLIYLIPGVMYSTLLASIGKMSRIFNITWRTLFPANWYLNKLRNGYSSEREEASKKLIKMGSLAVPGLIMLLRDNNYDTYELATEILGEIKDSRAIKPLKKLLKNEEMSVRETAAKTLEKMGWEPAKQEERLEYLFALRKFDELKELGDPAIAFLTEQLKYNYLPLCDIVIDFLAKIGTPAVPYLKKELNDRNRIIQTNAMEALKRMGWYPANDEENAIWRAAEERQKGWEQADYEAAVKKMQKEFDISPMPVNSSAAILGVGMPGSILKDLDPMTAGIIAAGLIAATFFISFKIFFPENWARFKKITKEISMAIPSLLIGLIGFCALPTVLYCFVHLEQTNIQNMVQAERELSLKSVSPEQIAAANMYLELIDTTGAFDVKEPYELLDKITKKFDLYKLLTYGDRGEFKKNAGSILKFHAEKYQKEAMDKEFTGLIFMSDGDIILVGKYGNSKPGLKSVVYRRMGGGFSEAFAVVGYVMGGTSGMLHDAALERAAISGYILDSSSSESLAEVYISNNVSGVLSVETLRKIADGTWIAPEFADPAPENMPRDDGDENIRNSRIELRMPNIATSTEQGMKKSPENGVVKDATQLFELIESALASERVGFIAAGNEIIKKADPSAGTIDEKMMTAEIRERVEGAMSVIEGLEKEDMPPETKAKMELLKNNLKQFEAAGFIGSVISMARNAKKDGRKCIIGLEDDWIPGMDIKNSLQRQAITVLMREIDRIAEVLRSAGLDNVEIIRGSGSQLANSVMKAARDSNIRMHNVVIMASLNTINSDSFIALRTADENDRPFLAGIDTTELIKSYEEFGENSSKQLYIQLTHMLCMTLELAAGKEPPQLPIIVSYDKKMRMVIFLPKAGPVDVEILKTNYAGESTALLDA